MDQEKKEKLKIKLYNAKVYAQRKVVEVGEWCKENREEAVMIASAVVSGLYYVTKTMAKNRRLEEERHLKEDYIYDRSTGHYFELRRKPTNAEWCKIDEMKRSGIPLYVILNDMRLLAR